MIVNATLLSEKLLMKAAEGDKGAFSQLFYELHQQLLSFTCQFTNSREDAKDIIQEVFVELWERKQDLLRIKNFHSYIYRSCKNRTLNYIRKENNERKKCREAAKNKKPSYTLSDFDEEPADYYTLLDQAVENLSLRQKKAYILSRRRRLRHKKIAEQMGVSPETVKKHLQLATQSIKSYLSTNIGK